MDLRPKGHQFKLGNHSEPIPRTRILRSFVRLIRILSLRNRVKDIRLLGIVILGISNENEIDRAVRNVRTLEFQRIQ